MVEEKAERGKVAENVVFVGTKPVMSYVLAVITQFNVGVGDVTSKLEERLSAGPLMWRKSLGIVFCRG